MKTSTTIMIAVVAVAGVLAFADQAQAGGFSLRIGGLSIRSGGYGGTYVVIGGDNDRYYRPTQHFRSDHRFDRDRRDRHHDRRPDWRSSRHDRRFYTAEPLRQYPRYVAVPQPYYPRHGCR